EPPTDRESVTSLASASRPARILVFDHDAISDRAARSLSGLPDQPDRGGEDRASTERPPPASGFDLRRTRFRSARPERVLDHGECHEQSRQFDAAVRDRRDPVAEAGAWPEGGV